MGGRKKKRRVSSRDRFDRAMVESTDLLADAIADVEFPIPADDFLLVELGRLVQDEQPSFRNQEFRQLVEQGIRHHITPSVDLRAQMVDGLRRALPGMSTAAQRIAPDVIGSIEDVDFPLDRVGAIVRVYTNQLFQKLEELPDTTAVESEARGLVERWHRGGLERSILFEELPALGSAAVPAVAEMIFESIDDKPVVETALELLASLDSSLSARVLAYLVSEPILEEPQEERARRALAEAWPRPRPYMLYRLRQHTHEDIPFRWLELFVEMNEPRAVDRILEEVLVHARTPAFREDLLTALGLLERSKDPGVVGKILQLMTEESAPNAVARLLEEWVEESRFAEPVERALERWNEGKTILVRAREDFNTFAARQPETNFDEVRRDWDAAYHESLGWQQRALFPRGPVEKEFERQLQETMMRELSLNPGLEEAALREQIESFRENWLITPRDNVIPLVAIYLERPRDSPWLEEIYWSEVNGWYVRSAQFLDAGEADRARRYLDVVLQLEPEYPLARMLDALMASPES